MDREASLELLDRLCRQADAPEHQCRFTWTTDAVFREINLRHAHVEVVLHLLRVPLLDDVIVENLVLVYTPITILPSLR